MKVCLFSLVVTFFILVFTTSNLSQGHQSPVTRLTYTRWINLLRYAYKSLRREPIRDHEEHFNRTSQVELISNSILKYFFNDIFSNPTFNEDDQIVFEQDRVPVDFLIMLDSSASIGSTNFGKAIQMLTNWVDILDEADFRNDKLRVGMLSFSEPDKVIHEFAFAARQIKSEVLDRMNSTEYHDGQSTSTATALWKADEIFRADSRPNVTKVIVLATDGWSHNVHQLPFGVLWPAARLRKLYGVKIFVVGIGDQINHNELKAVASRPSEKHLFEFPDYDMILEVLASVERKRSGIL